MRIASQDEQQRQAIVPGDLAQRCLNPLRVFQTLLECGFSETEWLVIHQGTDLDSALFSEIVMVCVHLRHGQGDRL
jgi:hypothetical protein